MTRLLGLLLGGALCLAGCGGGTLAEEMPSPAAGSLAIHFDTPLTLGTSTSARALVVTRTADGKRVATFAPIEASRPDDKGMLVAGSSDRGDIYMRITEHEIVVTWSMFPDDD
ncbi:MAG: hypothetical protein ACRD3C_18915 [Vicinamibacterales bacterium]